MQDDSGDRSPASMVIRPSHITVGAVLSSTGTFQVPRYQRNYAWRDDEVSAFLKDLDLCLVGRHDKRRRHHFFGGVVTALLPVPGSTRQNYELIDGQQRLATFQMLIMQARSAMLRLAHQLGEASTVYQFLTANAELLRNRYHTFQDTIDLRVVAVPRLQLSSPDDAFFDALLREAPIGADRQSHRRLLSAYEAIGGHLQGIVDRAQDESAKAKALESVVHVVEQDWTIIHMAAQERTDAYMLFQVLNDRGLNLTEGELLRSGTLETLDAVLPANEMRRVEESWDEILSGKQLDIRDGLKWVYTSQIGEWPGKTTFLQDLIKNLFPELNNGNFDRQAAERVVGSIRSLEHDFEILSKLCEGEWPLAPNSTITSWQKDRLRLLLRHLGQEDCLPLLVSGGLLKAADFAELVQLLERFCFRYFIVVDGPKLDAVNILNQHAVTIRRSPGDYRVGSLATELRDLVSRHAPDDVFASRLSELRYPRSSSKKPLKYFLMTLEHFVRWHDEGAQGRPVCRDLMRVLDFENATIEHIYPENAADPDPILEPLIDTLGNLTILSPKENDAAGAKPFEEKRRYLAESTSTLNNQIAEEPVWNAAAIGRRQTRLIDVAMKVFSI
ncbi:DUF262 domain-containing protein [Rhizobium sp. AU243]|uniref:DUF262 domain-containing protein n=1 Tax=Rhizobium sp. AU243 TaxID=2303425 RepID=UPI0010CCAA7B|nr:DUF262 domain-containing protein [Rhizobium sp. AU243]TKV70606.1 DUF262 domain-containing protein [Rhizobium sp. AU243]